MSTTCYITIKALILGIICNFNIISIFGSFKASNLHSMVIFSPVGIICAHANDLHSRYMDHSTSRLHLDSETCTVRGQITNYFILNLSCSTTVSYNDYALSDTLIQYFTTYTDNDYVWLFLKYSPYSQLTVDQ